MKVVVKLYSGHRKIVGKNTITVTLLPGATIDNLLDELIKCYPQLAEVLGYTTISVNLHQVKNDTRLNEGDSVSLFPHIGGG